MSRTKTAQREGKSAIERNLEAAVFGDEDFLDRFDEDLDEDFEAPDGDATAVDFAGNVDAYGGLDDDQLFVIDDGTVPQDETDEQKLADVDMADDENDQEDTRIAAWHDSDDERLNISLATAPRLRKLRRTEEEDIVSGLEYARRLRAQFERVYPVPDWALPAQQKRSRKRRSQSDDDASDSDSSDSPDAGAVALSANPLKALFRSSQSYIKSGKSSVRAPGKIEIKRLRDANHQAPSHAAIQTLSFHPTFPLVMTGGYDRMLRIYHVDGKMNSLASSLYLRNVPIGNAQFHPDGKRVFIGGKRKYFHIWNLETGSVEKISRMYGHEGMQTNMERFALNLEGNLIALVGSGGWINILSSETGQWIDAFKITRAVSDLVWHRNGHLTVANIGAELWEYDPLEKAVVRRWSDDGGFGTTKIALGGDNDRWIAIGSKSGIVNVYDRLLDTQSAPKPHKTLQQITTGIHDLRFSSDGQVLAMTSRAKKDVLKLVHLPTATVFQNWPTQNTPLGKIGAVAFSPGSEMFCVGNEAGKVTLWSI